MHGEIYFPGQQGFLNLFDKHADVGPGSNGGSLVPVRRGLNNFHFYLGFRPFPDQLRSHPVRLFESQGAPRLPIVNEKPAPVLCGSISVRSLGKWLLFIFLALEETLDQIDVCRLM